MSRTIHLDNSAEHPIWLPRPTVTIENLSFGRVVLKVSSETSSTTMALIEAAKP